MPYSDEMYDEMSGDAQHDHDMVVLNRMDDDYDYNPHEHLSEDRIIETFRKKGIIMSDLFEVAEDDNFDLELEMYDFELQQENRDAPFYAIQEGLIRKQTNHRKQAAKHKLWAPKKN